MREEGGQLAARMEVYQQPMRKCTYSSLVMTACRPRLYFI